MRIRLRLGISSLAAVAAAAAITVVPVTAATPQPFFQGFEANTTGWFGVTRVSSGTGGVASRTGGFHAEATSTGSFTQWGGYSDTFPVGGYTTSLAIYLDLASGASNDTRFDFSSAVNNPANAHRRDFVFNGGFYNDTDATGSGPRFVFSASNNAGRANAFPKNPGRDPFSITASGWYKLVHVFRDDGTGTLAVDLQLRNDAGTLLHAWTLSDATDVIGTTVGGNRYGWFATEEFPVLAIDDTRLDVRVGPPANKKDCKDGGWEQYDYPKEFKNQGDCIQYVNTGK